MNLHEIMYLSIYFLASKQIMKPLNMLLGYFPFIHI